MSVSSIAGNQRAVGYYPRMSPVLAMLVKLRNVIVVPILQLEVEVCAQELTASGGFDMTERAKPETED